MFHYYMFNKPFGCVTAHRDSLYPTVMDYFSELNNDNLNPVGRLDRETTGLLLISTRNLRTLLIIKRKPIILQFSVI